MWVFSLLCHESRNTASDERCRLSLHHSITDINSMKFWGLKLQLSLGMCFLRLSELEMAKDRENVRSGTSLVPKDHRHEIYGMLERLKGPIRPMYVGSPALSRKTQHLSPWVDLPFALSKCHKYQRHGALG